MLGRGKLLLTWNLMAFIIVYEKNKYHRRCIMEQIIAKVSDLRILMQKRQMPKVDEIRRGFVDMAERLKK
jgi:hypothetical protein